MHGIASLIPLKLVLLAMCLYSLVVPLVPFLDARKVNILFLDFLMCHQQLAERPRLIRHHLPFIDVWTLNGEPIIIQVSSRSEAALHSPLQSVPVDEEV